MDQDLKQIDNLYDELKALGYYEYMIHNWFESLYGLKNDDWRQQATKENFIQYYTDRT